MTEHSLPKTLYTAADVRAMDACAINEHGLPGALLMKRAGRVCFEVLCELFPNPEKIVVFCGGGNNGGDGYVIAGLAAQACIPVDVFYLVEPTKLKNDAERAYLYALREGVVCKPYTPQLELPEHAVLVDALLGTGLTGAARSDFAAAIEHMNQSGLPIVAVDLPSGLLADTGFIAGVAVQATATCTFIGQKIGLYTGAGPDVTGALYFDDLSVPQVVLDRPAPIEVLNLDALLAEVPERRACAHKGDFGHALILGGEAGFGGAALLAAEACARMGAGRTTLVTRAETALAANVRCPEVMAASVNVGCEASDLVAGATVIAVGPGLGNRPWGEQLLLEALTANKPLILDADALNLLAKGVARDAFAHRTEQPYPIILTPHPGEAARLLECSVEDIERDRPAAVRKLAQTFKATVLLKGAGSLIAAETGEVWLSPYGNPGMASGGMGDVLTGILAGLLAQQLNADHALALAVTLHGSAADQLAQLDGQRGLLAGDLIAQVRAQLNGL